MHEILSELAMFLDSGRWLTMLLLLLGLMVLIQLVKIQRGKNPVDFRYMFLDEKNRTSPSNIMLTGAFAITSWGFVLTAQKGLLTEWYVVSYIGAFVLNRQLTKYQDMQREWKLGSDAAVSPPIDKQQGGSNDHS